ncbi:Pinin/SDK/MemA protein [Ceraceosorus bombacis]|uniref:Pinin/SDK/MemA protein n=1 Tax=Ceraceosorus bombacis TaxID=401625 RepID=A0A0P1B7W5_9BASI|nr:Pinin/SDK/MemA protein [Ceraceosorus bombacis]
MPATRSTRSTRSTRATRSAKDAIDEASEGAQAAETEAKVAIDGAERQAEPQVGSGGDAKGKEKGRASTRKVAAAGNGAASNRAKASTSSNGKSARSPKKEKGAGDDEEEEVQEQVEPDQSSQSEAVQMSSATKAEVAHASPAVEVETHSAKTNSEAVSGMEESNTPADGQVPQGSEAAQEPIALVIESDPVVLAAPSGDAAPPRRRAADSATSDATKHTAMEMAGHGHESEPVTAPLDDKPATCVSPVMQDTKEDVEMSKTELAQAPSTRSSARQARRAAGAKAATDSLRLDERKREEQADVAMTDAAAEEETTSATLAPGQVDQPIEAEQASRSEMSPTRERENKESAVAPATKDERRVRPRMDNELAKRGKRMFGMLNSTLGKAKEENERMASGEGAKRRAELASRLANKRAANERLVECARRLSQLESQIILQASKISSSESAFNALRSSKHRLASFLVTPVGNRLRDVQMEKRERAKEVPNAIGPPSDRGEDATDDAMAKAEAEWTEDKAKMVKELDELKRKYAALQAEMDQESAEAASLAPLRPTAQAPKRAERVDEEMGERDADEEVRRDANGEALSLEDAEMVLS